MALSKPVIPDADEAVCGQHFLVCGTEDCERNCQFYCNPCHQQLCEQCKDEHLKNLDTKNHEVVPYWQRKRQLPVEKCKDHPTKDIDMFCEDCQDPVCSKCATHCHRKHVLNDLETIYSEKFTLCLDEIFIIHQYFLPTSRNMQEDIKGDFKDLKTTMNKIRTSMKSKAESLKNLIDTITSENIKEVNEMEERLLWNIHDQAKLYQDYISYLEDLVKEFNGYLSSNEVKNNPIFFSIFEHQNIQLIPETTKPVLPVFSAALYSKEDISKLLGRITFPDTKPEYREIKPMESAQLKPTEKERGKDREKSNMKQTLSLCSCVTKVREYTVPGVKNVYHVSLGKSGRLWGSDDDGNLVQTDLQGNQLQKIQTSGGSEGYHTVTQDGDLIYTDIENEVIYRMKQDKTTTEFTKTGDWEPISVYSSHINWNILVGMRKDGETKVTRYNKAGKEIQNIQRNNKGQKLYGYPGYITENINGDICTSDLDKEAVVVVNKSGQYRFSYTGQRSELRPLGICTDNVGHILVCSPRESFFFYFTGKIHVLDQDGQFLSELPTSEFEIGCPLSLCVDDERNLHWGQLTNTVKVYKYLE